MVDLQQWLADHGLAHHAMVLQENGIAADVLHDLTDADLKELGLNLGDRRRLLKAIATFGQRRDPLPPASHDQEAERRQLTVMFVDLVGSTELSTGLDLEDLREVISAYYSTVAQAVERFDGHVAKHIGDGVIAYWGWPQAREDAAARAVRAGLAVIDDVGRMRPHGEAVLQVRVGIATGLVVVGNIIGQGAAHGEVVGETPNLAARLQTLAEPGSMVIAEATRRLIGHEFVCEDLGKRHLRGFPAPVPVTRIVAEASTVDGIQARRSVGYGPLVGREPELGRLIERWKRVTVGRGQVVLLIGEAGIGKSRVTEAFLEQVAGDVPIERHFACSPLHETSTLYPVLMQLERAAGFSHNDPPAWKLAKLAATLALAGAEADEAASALAGLMGILDPDLRPGAGPQMRKERTLELLTEHLLDRPDDRPLVLVFEDVYWADPTSLGLIGRLVERVPTLPVLLLVVSRPGFAAGWSGLPHVLALSVDRLNRADAALVATAVATATDAILPLEMLEQIVDRTDGVPLFIEELTRAVVEAGWQDVPNQMSAEPAPAIPVTLQDSLLARLDRLGPAKQVAQIGAALGQSFSVELLCAVVPWARSELEEAVAVLLGADLIRKTQEGTRPTYRFKHALVREVAYETLLRGRRRQLHARIAEILASRFTDTPPELLAYHHARAGETWQAVHQWLRAGELSLRHGAVVEACAQLTAGLSLLASLPEGSERHRHEIRLDIALGEAMSLTQGRAALEVGQLFARACELCRLEDEPPGMAAALSGLYGFHLHRAELNEARAVAEELLHLAEWQSDSAMRATALAIGGSIAFFLGRLSTAISALEAALADEALAPRLAIDESTSGVQSRLLGLTYLCWAQLVQGQMDVARQRSRKTIAEAATLSHQPAVRVAALFSDCVANQLVRDSSIVLARVEIVMPLASEQDFPLWRAGASILRGWAVGDAGEMDTALRQMRQGLAAWRLTGAEHLVPYFQALLADICVRAGRRAEGLRLVDDGLARAERTGERWCEAELMRLQGVLLLLGGSRHRTAAEACLHRARALARRQGARLWELRASVSLARLWANDKPSRTRRMLATICDGFTEGFDTPDLLEARALLEALA